LGRFRLVFLLALRGNPVPRSCDKHSLARERIASERLDKAVKRLRYTVEQQSSTRFLCKPKHGLARLFEFSKLHIRLLDGSVDLIGPAVAVNKVRKQLLANSQ
jgi:hypothetical protein